MKRLVVATIALIALAIPASASAAKPQLLTVPPANSSQSSVTFEFTIALSNFFECRIDGGPLSLCTSPITYTSLAEGPHSFEVRADHLVCLDMLCTILIPATSDFALFNFVIDRSGPAVAFTGGPKQGSASRNRTALVAFSSDPGSTFTCTFDKRSPEPCESPVEWRNLEVGLHRVKIRATDTAGNVGPDTSLEFAVNSKTVTYRSIGKTSAKRCVKKKLKKNGKVVRTKSGKVRYKTTCKRVKF